MFVLLFVYVFGGAISGSLPAGVSYVDYLLPGIFVQSVTFRATNTAVGLSEDLRRGVIDRFRSMPMARSAVLVGRTTADLLVFSTIQPVMFVVLFVYVFGGAVGLALPAGVSYVDYLLPGIFVQSVTFRATNTAVGLSEDLRRGVIDRFRSMPMARSAVLLGRTTADLVRNILIIGLMIGVGYLVGFSFQAGVIPALACVALVAAFGFALSWIFAFVSLVVQGAETAQTAGFVLLFPLVFASSVFVPISSMPDWLQPIAEASPVTLTANAARTFALTGGVPGSLAGSLAWIVGILALFVPLSVWRYRRMS